MTNPIQFYRLDRQYQSLKEQLLDVTDKVYSSGQVLDGQYTKEFSYQMAERANRKFALTVNSCSTALLISYLYLSHEQKFTNISIPSYSFIATSNAPLMAGCNVSYLDVDRNGLLNLDQLDVSEHKTQILSYVNLYGNVIDYHKLRMITEFFHELYVVEDAAQSFGASYKGIPSGKLGYASCLSFDPTKNLPNYGSGGMILTDDPMLYEFAQNFCDNGKQSAFVRGGTNLKMNEVDCAQMLIKLSYFDSWQNRRNEIAKYYTEHLSTLPLVNCPETSPDVVHAWSKYVITTEFRNGLKDFLTESRIQTKVHYPYTIAPTTVMVPMATMLTESSLSLPIYPELFDSEVEYIVEKIKKFYQRT